MWYLTRTPVPPGGGHWRLTEGPASDEEDGLKVSFRLIPSAREHTRRHCVKTIERMIEKQDVLWIAPGHKEWTVDLDKLKELAPELSSLEWFKGQVSVEPELETEKRIVFGGPEYDASVVLYIGPEQLGKRSIILEPPPAIQESLERFRRDYPDRAKVGFIMMQFRETEAHHEIEKAIRSVLDSHGLIGVKAIDKQYHDDLFPNVLTYLHGCGFGVTVFERIEAEEFNPNVSLEVGYMFALRKPVCLLKDRTLKTLHTDLVGKLYRVFDPQDPLGTIPSELSAWLSDKGIT